MSLVGSLSDIHLGDLLQVLAGSQSSGKLSLARSDRQGLIVLRQGRIIYAASTSVRETLGSILVARRLVSEEELARALELQHGSQSEKRLGGVLEEMDLLTHEELVDTVKWQVTRVVAEFLLWRDAYFKFEPLDIPDHGEVEVDLKELVIREGLAPESVVLGLLSTESPAARERLVADLAEAARRGRRRLTSLSVIMSEIQPPALTGELVARILSAGARVAPRGVLFTLRNRAFGCRAHFGIADPSSLQELVIPIWEPSILGLVAEHLETHHGPLFYSPLNEDLVRALGGPAPKEVLVIPMVIGRRVEAVFYGDSPGGEPLGASDELEALIAEASLAMEEEVLAKRRSYLERTSTRRAALGA